MNIQPRAFLLAKQSTDYFLKVFDVEIEDELYKFHIYNLAVILNMQVTGSDKMIEHMANRDNFREEIETFHESWANMFNANQEL